MTTLAGVYQSQGKVMLTRLHLPESDKNRIVDSQEALVFDSPCRYDIILGSDFSRRLELTFGTQLVHWNG